jgi:hypothetical protein
MDLETQLALYKGNSPTQKAKAHILQLFQMVEDAHKKIVKHTASKTELDEFLDKCIMSPTKPKILRDIGEISVKVDEARGILLDAKEAEEKRQERAAKRHAKKEAQQPTMQQALLQAIGGITVNVNIQNGGAEVSTSSTNPTKVAKAPKPKEYKKRPIPKNVRNQTWNQYIGAEKGEAPCYCCGIHKIDKASFDAGHVIPEVKGGPSTIENLRPICRGCNLSMGDTNMREYALKYYKKEI